MANLLALVKEVSPKVADRSVIQTLRCDVGFGGLGGISPGMPKIFVEMFFISVFSYCFNINSGQCTEVPTLGRKVYSSELWA